MSADKFQSVHEALADVFNASNPNATGTASSHTAFDHDTLSEAFNEPRPNEAGTDLSLARLDHATLTGMFSEPSSEIQTTFDDASAEILSERSQLATDTPAPQPGFDHEMVAEILTEPPTISANTKPPQPSFDHQALAEMLTEARADPIDPPTSPLSFDTEPSSSSALFSSQVQQSRPATRAFAASPLTNAEGARPPKAKSLFAKLHQIFSTKEEPALSYATPAGEISSPGSITAESSPLTFERNSSLPELPSPDSTSPLALETESSRTCLSDQPENRDTASANSGSALPQLPNSFLEEQSHLPTTESSPADLQAEASSPTLFDRSKDMLTVPSAASRSPRTNVESGRPQRLQRLLAELTSTISAKSEPRQTSEKDPSCPTPSTQVESLEPPAATTPVAPQANAESASIRSPETPRWPNKILTPASTNAESQSFIFQNDSTTIDSDQTDSQESARIIATAALPDTKGAQPQEEELPASLIAGNSAFDATPDSPEVATEPALPLPTRAMATRPQTKLLQPTAPPGLDSADNKSLLPIIEQDFPSPSLPNRPESAVPSVKSVIAAHPPETEDAPPQLSSSLLAALHVLNTKPSPPVVEKEPSRTRPASHLDRAGISAKSVNDPKDAEKSLARQTKSLPTEVHAVDSTDSKSSAPISRKEPSSSPISNRPTGVAQTANAIAIAHPADTENAVERVQQAKSLLAELDVNTAIHLRWVMRDIRSKRTKFSPVSTNDLKALMDLGLVETREGLPRLTGLGFIELD